MIWKHEPPAPFTEAQLAAIAEEEARLRKAGKRKHPAQVRLISHGLRNGYPLGGMSIEGGEPLPSGIYRCAHAADFLLREGWPDTTVVLYRNEGLDYDSFRPLTLAMAAATEDKKLPQKPKSAARAGAEAAEASEAPKAAKPAPSVRISADKGQIKRPKAGGKCAAAWDLLDSLVSEGALPDRKTAMAAGAAAGLSPGNIGAEYGNWKRWRAQQ
jgi:hypothetical protein